MIVWPSAEFDDWITFRDYLRLNAAAAQTYADEKRRLAKLFYADRGSYVEGKTDIVRRLLDEAAAAGQRRTSDQARRQFPSRSRRRVQAGAPAEPGLDHRTTGDGQVHPGRIRCGHAGAAVLGWDWVMAGMTSFEAVQSALCSLGTSDYRRVGWSILWNLTTAQLRDGRSVMIDGVARRAEVDDARRIAAENGSTCSRGAYVVQ